MAERRSYQQTLWRRRFGRRQMLRNTALGGAGLATAAIIGCGQEEPSGPPSGAGAAPGPGAAPAARQPKRGGNLAANNRIGEAPHMDPHQNATLTLHDNGIGPVFSRLLRWKLEEGVYPNSIVPDGDLAEKWEQPDPQTLVFHLHRGVKWHNIPPVNGRDLVAQDVVFSYDRQVSEKVNAELLEAAAKSLAPDKDSVRIELKHPEADFLLNLAAVQSKVVAREAVEVKGNLKEGPTLGTGPWIFKEWQRSQLVRMERNPNYFRSGLPYGDTLTIFRIPDPQTEIAAFRTKQIQVIDRVDGRTQDLLRREEPNLALLDARLFGSGTGVRVWLHADKKPTADVRVRQAVSKLVDREAFIKTIMSGAAWISSGIFVPSMDWVLPEGDLKRLLAQDAAGARQLLSAAGVTNWAPSVKIFQPPDARLAGDLFIAQVRPFGINPTGEIVDNIRQLGEVWGRGEYEINVSLIQPQSTPTSLLRKFYRTGGSQNGGKLSDRQLDEWIDKQSTLVGDQEGRKKLLQDIQRRVIDLAAVVPIYSLTENSLTWPFLKNYFQARSGDYSRWEKAWLDL